MKRAKKTKKSKKSKKTKRRQSSLSTILGRKDVQAHIKSVENRGYIRGYGDGGFHATRNVALRETVNKPTKAAKK
jgi:hypothetical protein